MELNVVYVIQIRIVYSYVIFESCNSSENQNAISKFLKLTINYDFPTFSPLRLNSKVNLIYM